jgi:hypothetical protein
MVILTISLVVTFGNPKLAEVVALLISSQSKEERRRETSHVHKVFRVQTHDVEDMFKCGLNSLLRIDVEQNVDESVSRFHIVSRPLVRPELAHGFLECV